MSTSTERVREWRRNNSAKYKANSAAYREANADKIKAYQREYCKNNKDRALARYRGQRYGLSEDDYKKMLSEQEYKCLICGGSILGHRKASVDHCHVTDKIRGLLCSGCNRGIGLFKDNPILVDKAAAYLRQHEKDT